MKHLHFLALFIIPICLSCKSSPSDSSIVDYSFEEVFNQDSIQLKRIENIDSIQKYKLSMAQKYLRYYRNNPNSITGEKAVLKALKIWDYAGEYETLRMVFSEIDVNDRIWHKAAYRLRMSFIMENKLDDFHSELVKFKLVAKNPLSLAFIYMNLAESFYRSYKQEGQPVSRDSSITYYQKYTEISTDTSQIKRIERILHELRNVDIGNAFPSLTGVDIFGEEINSGNFRGKVLLVEFWATWCGPCLPEIPYYQELYSRHSREDFDIIAISLDTEMKKLKDFIKENELRWIQICDGKKWESEYVDSYNPFRSIPKSYLIDREGIIQFKDLRGEEMVAAVNSLINK